MLILFFWFDSCCAIWVDAVVVGFVAVAIWDRWCNVVDSLVSVWMCVTVFVCMQESLYAHKTLGGSNVEIPFCAYKEYGMDSM